MNAKQWWTLVVVTAVFSVLGGGLASILFSSSTVYAQERTEVNGQFICNELIVTSENGESWISIGELLGSNMGIVFKRGKRRDTFIANKSTGLSLSISDKKGKQRISMGMIGDNPGFTMHDEEGNRRLQISNYEKGQSVDFYNKSGRRGISIHSDDDDNQQMSFYTGDGIYPRASIGYNPEWGGSVSISGGFKKPGCLILEDGIMK